MNINFRKLDLPPIPNIEATALIELVKKKGKYNSDTGLPKPSAEKLDLRRYRVERWKRDIIRLEQEAQEYCQLFH